VGESPRLWAWVRLTVHSCGRTLAAMPAVLGLARLQAVRRLKVMAVSRELLQAMAGHPGLREVLWSGPRTRVPRPRATHDGLASVEPGLLARAVSGLETAGFNDLSLDSLQAEAILEDVVKSKTGLINLTIRNIDISLVDPSLLATAVTMLVKVALVPSLTINQANAIFTAISCHCRLKSLDISGANLSSVDPDLMGQVVSKLGEANLSCTRLTNHQTLAIVTAISKEDSKIKVLDITGANVSSVDPDLLARTVNRLEEVNMFETDPTGGQMEAILTSSLEGSSLKKLRISNAGRVANRELTSRARLAIGDVQIW
jgi:uncharacterized protein YjbI with pentapeptide repeats